MNVLNRIPSYFFNKKALPYHLFFLPLQRNKGSIAQKRLYKWLIQLLQHKQPCDGLPALQGIFYNADIRGSISADPLRIYQRYIKRLSHVGYTQTHQNPALSQPRQQVPMKKLVV
jgi:hypothetical protein